MMALTHVILGAAIGEKVAYPIVAFGAGVASHFIADKIPHYWPKSKKGQDHIMWFDIISIFAIFMVFLFWPLSNKSGIFWGALGGGVVDFVLVLLPKFFPKMVDYPIRVWHEKRQYHYDKLAYLTTDILLTFITLIFLLC